MMGSAKKKSESTQWPESFAICTTVTVSSCFVLVASLAEFPPEASLAGLVMIQIRYPQIFHTRRLAFSIPLFVVFLTLPIVVQWEPVLNEWTSLKRPLPMSQWITWGIAYMALPTLLFLMDYVQIYENRIRQLGRILVDVVTAAIWMFVFISIVESLGHKN